MKYYEKIFEKIKPIAIESNNGWARLCSAIVYKNQIVATGVNSMKSHTFQKRFGSNPDAIFLHSETCAILNSLRVVSVDDLTNMDMYVLRVKRNGANTDFQYGMSKPCIGCQRCILTFGIRQVFYTCDDGTIECL